MRPFRIIPLLTVLAFAPSLTAQANSSEEDYPTLLARFQAGDPTVDVTALRIAFTRTEAYQPHDLERVTASGDVLVLLAQGNPAAAARTAERLLAQNWMDIKLHSYAGMAYDELGDDSAAAVHQRAARLLLASIGGPNDGRTPEAPLQVIDAAEINMYMRAYGFTRQPERASCSRPNCLAIRVMDEQARQFTLYFDTSISSSHARPRRRR